MTNKLKRGIIITMMTTNCLLPPEESGTRQISIMSKESETANEFYIPTMDSYSLRMITIRPFTKSQNEEKALMGKEKYTIDFSNVNDYLEMHTEIRKALKFPDDYGCNWSAFWDCLSDMYGNPIHIEIIGLDVIERKFGDSAAKMIEILKRFKHFNDDLFSDSITIEIVSGDVRVSLK